MLCVIRASRDQCIGRVSVNARSVISNLPGEHVFGQVVDPGLLADRVLACRDMMVEEIRIVGMRHSVARGCLLQVRAPPALLVRALLAHVCAGQRDVAP